MLASLVSRCSLHASLTLLTFLVLYLYYAACLQVLRPFKPLLYPGLLTSSLPPPPPSPSAPPSAMGVSFLDSLGARRVALLKAGGEVILAAGALGSPQLLLLSGLGPRRKLQVRELGPRRKLQV